MTTATFWFFHGFDALLVATLLRYNVFPISGRFRQTNPSCRRAKMTNKYVWLKPTFTYEYVRYVFLYLSPDMSRSLRIKPVESLLQQQNTTNVDTGQFITLGPEG